MEDKPNRKGESSSDTGKPPNYVPPFTSQYQFHRAGAAIEKHLNLICISIMGMKKISQLDDRRFIEFLTGVCSERFENYYGCICQTSSFVF